MSVLIVLVSLYSEDRIISPVLGVRTNLMLINVNDLFHVTERY